MPAPLIFNSRAEVRDALWLWTWLLSYTKNVDADWQPVADGIAIPDAQIAWNLDVSVETVRRWRRRLERLAFIRTQIVRPRYRQYWMVRVRPNDPARALMESASSSTLVN